MYTTVLLSFSHVILHGVSFLCKRPKLGTQVTQSKKPQVEANVTLATSPCQWQSIVAAVLLTVCNTLD